MAQPWLIPEDFDVGHGPLSAEVDLRASSAVGFEGQVLVEGKEAMLAVVDLASLFFDEDGPVFPAYSPSSDGQDVFIPELVLGVGSGQVVLPVVVHFGDGFESSRAVRVEEGELSLDEGDVHDAGQPVLPEASASFGVVLDGLL